MTVSTDTFLLAEEIQALTARKVRSAQARVLKGMGIEHRIRPDGSVAILRAHITKVFDGAITSQTKAKTISPNWGAM